VTKPTRPIVGVSTHVSSLIYGWEFMLSGVRSKVGGNYLGGVVSKDKHFVGRCRLTKDKDQIF